MGAVASAWSRDIAAALSTAPIPALSPGNSRCNIAGALAADEPSVHTL